MRELTLFETSQITGSEFSEALKIIGFFTLISGVAGGVTGSLAWFYQSPILGTNSLTQSVFSAIGLSVSFATFSSLMIYAGMGSESEHTHHLFGHG